MVHPSHVLVASDFDGTLSEIVAEPGRARALPAAVSALSELRGMVAALADLVAATSAGGVVFLGDDYGDRGCFDYLAGLDRPHLAVGVASEETPAEVFAHCDLIVEGPSGAAEFLSRLVEAARARGHAG